MSKISAQPTYKDIAKFFRMGLQAGICGVPAIVRWADSIISIESSPAFAFIELSLCGSQPISTVVSLLSEVPGQSTPELPAYMLLGYCSGSVRAGTRSATEVLLQLYRTARSGDFPEVVTDDFSWYEDELSLARDQVHGTLSDVTERFSTFLSDFESYARAVPTGTVRPAF